MAPSLLHADRRIDRRGARHGTDEPLRLLARGTSRRPLLALGSLALVVTSTAAFVGLYAHAGARQPVLALQRTVTPGSRITASDLTVVDISATRGLASIPVHDARQVVGQTAATLLVTGTLVTRAELKTSSGTPSGDVIVGVAAQPGQLPAGGVRAGDIVDVDVTAPSGSLDATAQGSPAPTGSAATVTVSGAVIAQDARIVGVADGSGRAGGGPTVVSVAVPEAIGPLVANASVAGQVAITLVSGAR